MVLRMADPDLIHRLESVEQELESIKRALKGKNIKLASRLKGVRFDEEDFHQASDSIFNT